MSISDTVSPAVLEQIESALLASLVPSGMGNERSDAQPASQTSARGGQKDAPREGEAKTLESTSSDGTKSAFTVELLDQANNLLKLLYPTPLSLKHSALPSVRSSKLRVGTNASQSTPYPELQTRTSVMDNCVFFYLCATVVLDPAAYRRGSLDTPLFEFAIGRVKYISPKGTEAPKYGQPDALEQSQTIHLEVQPGFSTPVLYDVNTLQQLVRSLGLPVNTNLALPPYLRAKSQSQQPKLNPLSVPLEKSFPYVFALTTSDPSLGSGPHGGSIRLRYSSPTLRPEEADEDLAATAATTSAALAITRVREQMQAEAQLPPLVFYGVETFRMAVPTVCTRKDASGRLRLQAIEFIEYEWSLTNPYDEKVQYLLHGPAVPEDDPFSKRGMGALPTAQVPKGTTLRLPPIAPATATSGAAGTKPGGGAFHLEATSSPSLVSKLHMGFPALDNRIYPAPSSFEITYFLDLVGAANFYPDSSAGESASFLTTHILSALLGGEHTGLGKGQIFVSYQLYLPRGSGWELYLPNDSPYLQENRTEGWRNQILSLNMPHAPLEQGLHTGNGHSFFPDELSDSEKLQFSASGIGAFLYPASKPPASSALTAHTSSDGLSRSHSPSLATEEGATGESDGEGALERATGLRYRPGRSSRRGEGGSVADSANAYEQLASFSDTAALLPTSTPQERQQQSLRRLWRPVRPDRPDRSAVPGAEATTIGSLFDPSGIGGEGGRGRRHSSPSGGTNAIAGASAFFGRTESFLSPMQTAFTPRTPHSAYFAQQDPRYDLSAFWETHSRPTLVAGVTQASRMLSRPWTFGSSGASCATDGRAPATGATPHQCAQAGPAGDSQAELALARGQEDPFFAGNTFDPAPGLLRSQGACTSLTATAAGTRGEFGGSVSLVSSVSAPLAAVRAKENPFAQPGGQPVASSVHGLFGSDLSASDQFSNGVQLSTALPEDRTSFAALSYPIPPFTLRHHARYCVNPAGPSPPTLILTVYSTTSTGATQVEGYAYLDLPLTAGSQDVSVTCWRERSIDPNAEEREFFLGSEPLPDLARVKVPLDAPIYARWGEDREDIRDAMLDPNQKAYLSKMRSGKPVKYIESLGAQLASLLNIRDRAFPRKKRDPDEKEDKDRRFNNTTGRRGLNQQMAQSIDASASSKDDEAKDKDKGGSADDTRKTRTSRGYAPVSQNAQSDGEGEKQEKGKDSSGTDEELEYAEVSSSPSDTEMPLGDRRSDGNPAEEGAVGLDAQQARRAAARKLRRAKRQQSRLLRAAVAALPGVSGLSRIGLVTQTTGDVGIRIHSVRQSVLSDARRATFLVKGGEPLSGADAIDAPKTNLADVLEGAVPASLNATFRGTRALGPGADVNPRAAQVALLLPPSLCQASARTRYNVALSTYAHLSNFVSARENTRPLRDPGSIIAESDAKINEDLSQLLQEWGYTQYGTAQPPAPVPINRRTTAKQFTARRTTQGGLGLTRPGQRGEIDTIRSSIQTSRGPLVSLSTADYLPNVMRSTEELEFRGTTREVEMPRMRSNMGRSSSSTREVHFAVGGGITAHSPRDQDEIRSPLLGEDDRSKSPTTSTVQRRLFP